MNSTIPPFSINQKVVCIEGFEKSKELGIICPEKDDILTVRTIHIGDTGLYYLRFYEITNSLFLFGNTFDKEISFVYDHFAPITSTFQHITYKEVLEKEMEVVGVN